jgi:hypothetical protein
MAPVLTLVDRVFQKSYRVFRISTGLVRNPNIGAIIIMEMTIRARRRIFQVTARQRPAEGGMLDVGCVPGMIDLAA